jgi:uncharacterized membrane protein YdbT with pleckstrin-like domain
MLNIDQNDIHFDTFFVYKMRPTDYTRIQSLQNVSRFFGMKIGYLQLNIKTSDHENEGTENKTRSQDPGSKNCQIKNKRILR